MKSNNYEHIIHPFKPVYTKSSEILILGSFPSVKSRENSFYYSNPRNRFWEILATLYDESTPNTVNEMIGLLENNRIALYDVVFSCDIVKSYDNSIKNIIPTDLSSIIHNSNINSIFTNGRKADELYVKYQEGLVGIKSVCLPSSSPANAKYSTQELLIKWKIIKDRR